MLHATPRLVLACITSYQSGKAVCLSVSVSVSSLSLSLSLRARACVCRWVGGCVYLCVCSAAPGRDSYPFDVTWLLKLLPVVWLVCVCVCVCVHFHARFLVIAWMQNEGMIDMLPYVKSSYKELANEASKVATATITIAKVCTHGLASLRKKW